MKEPFVNIDNLIDQAKLLNELELQAYISDIDPSRRSEFIQGNVGRAVRESDASKKAKFNDLYDQTIGSDNSITSAAYYLARTSDLKKLTKDVDDVAVKQLDSLEINTRLASRQNEINDWANFNKLDTLFFMQILLISLSICGIMAYLLSMGLIERPLFFFVCAIIACMAVLVLLLKWRYTNVNRNNRYWHKSIFPRQNKQFAVQSNVCNTNPG
jgi:hypothetical protein